MSFTAEVESENGGEDPVLLVPGHNALVQPPDFRETPTFDNPSVFTEDLDV